MAKVKFVRKKGQKFDFDKIPLNNSEMLEKVFGVEIPEDIKKGSKTSNNKKDLGPQK